MQALRSRTSRFKAGTFTAALALVLTACGSASDSASDSEGGVEAATLKLSISTTSLAWLPYYVAHGAGFFEDQNLTIEAVQSPAAGATTAAIIAGDADMASVGSNTPFDANEAGQNTKMISIMTDQFTSVVTGRKEHFDQLNVTPESPLDERLDAIAKSRIGVTAIGSGSEVIFRYALEASGADISGMEVQPSGDAAATLAQMRQGRIDATPFSPPIPQQAIADGFGAIYLDTIAGEVPQLDGMAYTAFTSTDDTIAAKRDELVRFIMAIEQALRLIQSDPEAAAEAASKSFESTDPELFEAAFAMMISAVPDSVEITEESIDKARDVYEAAFEKEYSFESAEVVDYELGKEALERLGD